MKLKILENYNSHFLKGSEVPSMGPNVPGAAEGNMGSQDMPIFNDRQGSKEPISKERQEQIDLLMVDVKNFIRNIDVNKL